MALQDLNRAQDTPIATLKLAEITPKNWHRFPPRIATSVPTFVRDVRYINGATGDDVTQSTAAVAYTFNSPAPENAAYTPLTQAAKATALGTTIVEDVGRNRGWIAPGQPYGPKPGAGSNPTLTALTPNTAVAGAATPQFVMKLTGTNFTPYSTVQLAGKPAPLTTYISPTEMRVQMSPASSVAGTVAVTVTDHSVVTAAQTFTYT